MREGREGRGGALGCEEGGEPGGGWGEGFGCCQEGGELCGQGGHGWGLGPWLGLGECHGEIMVIDICTTTSNAQISLVMSYMHACAQLVSFKQQRVLIAFVDIQYFSRVELSLKRKYGSMSRRR